MLRKIANGFRALFHREREEHELHAELQDYLEHAIEQKVAAGMPRKEALRRARAEMGSAEAIKDYVRDAGWESAIESVWTDLRFAARMTRRTPALTAIIIVTLAAGIGANAALFSVVNAVLLKPLPVKNPDQLVLMVWDWADQQMLMARGYEGSATDNFSAGGHLQGTSFSYLTYKRLLAEKDTFASVIAFAPIEQLNVVADGSAEVATGQYVSGSYYSGLGVPAWRGRMLMEQDDRPGAPPAAVITWRYWQRRFGGEASAIGKQMIVNEVPFTIVGVSPPEFAGTLELHESADISMPISIDPVLHAANPAVGKPGLWWLRLMGRLRPGVSRAQAQARMDAVFQASAIDGWKAGIDASKPKTSAAVPTVYPHLMLAPGAQGDEFDRLRYRQPLGLLMAVVGLVLLVACINVANLLLARSSARQQEFAMRAALGASRWRLARQLLTECVLLALLAGAAGCASAFWTKDILLRWAAWMRGGMEIKASLDVRVLAFTAAISLLTGIVFGLLPALRAGTAHAPARMRAEIGHAGRRRGLAARGLITAQVAVSVVLLGATALFLRTMRNLSTVDAGFDVRNVLVFRVKPETNGYTDANVGALYQRMMERISAIPGVENVSLSRHPLLNFSHRVKRVFVKAGDPNNGDRAEVNVVSPSFFDTMRMPVLVGRKLRDSDTATSTNVVVVNETFARKYFAGANPIGQRFWLDSGGEGTGHPLRQTITAPPNDQPLEIAGVARDAKYTKLRNEVEPTVYQSFRQSPSLQAAFEVRYHGDESTVSPALRAAVQQVDARLPIFDLRTQVEQLEDNTGEERMFANLSSCIGGLTLLLAAVGLYGIMSYNVGQRTAEIGVRMTLGAQPRAVLGMILRDSLAVVVVGLGAGIPLALAAARATSKVLEDLLFGVRATDPVSFSLAAVTLGAVALAASYFPARRAANTDPLVALRRE